MCRSLVSKVHLRLISPRGETTRTRAFSAVASDVARDCREK